LVMAEIWYTCSLSKYLGVFFFSFFEVFYFVALEKSSIEALKLSQARLARYYF